MLPEERSQLKSDTIPDNHSFPESPSNGTTQTASLSIDELENRRKIPIECENTSSLSQPASIPLPGETEHKEFLPSAINQFSPRTHVTLALRDSENTSSKRTSTCSPSIILDTNINITPETRQVGTDSYVSSKKHPSPSKQQLHKLEIALNEWTGCPGSDIDRDKRPAVIQSNGGNLSPSPPARKKKNPSPSKEKLEDLAAKLGTFPGFKKSEDKTISARPRDCVLTKKNVKW